MSRIYVLVEGQTEETFVRDQLAPHLLDFGVFAGAVLTSTKRVLKRPVTDGARRPAGACGSIAYAR